MAYLRWGQESDWYVFWEAADVPAKRDERVAVWHADIRDHAYSVSYGEAREMLVSGEFGAIPGYSERYRATIAGVLAAFVEDVDLDYAQREV
jgi:hypothetical protein